jgi:hypothetical protein
MVFINNGGCAPKRGIALDEEKLAIEKYHCGLPV